MASLPTRRCPRCLRKVVGSCEECRKKAMRQQVRWRAPAHKRGYDHRWRKARKEHLQREPICRLCLGSGRTTAGSVVDHITPHRGDQQLFWDRTNWQTLCVTCHCRKTGRGQ